MSTAVCSKSVELQPLTSNTLYEVRYDDEHPREMCGGALSRRDEREQLNWSTKMTKYLAFGICFCMLRHSIYSTRDRPERKPTQQPRGHERVNPHASPASISASSLSVSWITFFSSADGSRYGLRGLNLSAEPPRPASLAE